MILTLQTIAEKHPSDLSEDPPFALNLSANVSGYLPPASALGDDMCDQSGDAMDEDLLPAVEDLSRDLLTTKSSLDESASADAPVTSLEGTALSDNQLDLPSTHTVSEWLCFVRLT